MLDSLSACFCMQFSYLVLCRSLELHFYFPGKRRVFWGAAGNVPKNKNSQDKMGILSCPVMKSVSSAPASRRVPRRLRPDKFSWFRYCCDPEHLQGGPHHGRPGKKFGQTGAGDCGETPSRVPRRLFHKLLSSQPKSACATKADRFW